MRREDWFERLVGYVDAHRSTAFVWGKHDCATFAAGAVEIMTGRAPDVPGYTSAHEALAHLVEHPMGEWLTELVGAEVPIAQAQRGDVVLLELGGRLTCGVCMGRESVAPGADGVLFVPTALASRAWRV